MTSISIHLFDRSGTLVSCMDVPDYATPDMQARIRRIARSIATSRGWKMTVIKPAVALAVGAV